jgi:hypothetical protein
MTRTFERDGVLPLPHKDELLTEEAGKHGAVPPLAADENGRARRGHVITETFELLISLS